MALSSIAIPKYVGHVNDFENILNNDTELEKTLSDFENETTVQIAILTVPDFQGVTIEDYAVKIFETWGIGQKDKDNGLLILVSKKERETRIEVGYGLEGTLPDALTGRIQDNYVLPSFKQNDYSTGVSNEINEIIKVIKKDPSAVTLSSVTSDDKTGTSYETYAIIFFFIIYILGMSKSWWLGGVIGFGFGIYIGYTYLSPFGIFICPIPFAILGLIIDYIVSKTPIGTILMYSRGFGSRSGSSGSGFSFGGGHSGGGGSSRSW